MEFPAQPNQSLIDGLACLQSVASSTEPVGSRALARELGLEPTRVNRLLRTLAALGLAEQDEFRRYRPGPAIHVLAAQAMFGSGLLRRAVPELDELREFKLTVAMGVLWRDRVAYLYHAHPNTPAGQAMGRAALFPASRSGLGLAILAQRRNPDIVALFPDPDERQAVMQAVRLARQNGYALARRPEHHSIAVCLDTHADVAIGLAGRFREHDHARLAEALRDAAGRITSKQGLLQGESVLSG